MLRNPITLKFFRGWGGVSDPLSPLDPHMASELIIGKLQKHKFMSICDHVLFGIAEKSEITFMILHFGHICLGVCISYSMVNATNYFKLNMQNYWHARS